MDTMEKKLEQLALYMEKMKLAEYIDLLHSPRRLMWVNFLAGIARRSEERRVG